MAAIGWEEGQGKMEDKREREKVGRRGRRKREGRIKGEGDGVHRMRGVGG